MKTTVILLTSAWLLWSLPSQAQTLAPVNPKFIRHIETLKAKSSGTKSVCYRSLGYAPAPLDLSHLAGSRLRGAAKSFAASYDLRGQDKLTPVKNQGSYGTCWSFATYGSLESCLLPSATNDFSENNMVNLHGFDNGVDDGGNAYMSTAYLTRWAGPVNESDDPYPNIGGSPAGLPVRRHIQNVEFIPDRSGATDNDNIKQTIVDYGALLTSLCWDDAYYRSAAASYYYNGSEDANHAVAIVGWDDNYSKANFATQPPGNGAFIIKNSWGTAWGENGYCYVSYYDSGIGLNNTVFLDAETTNNYGAVYQYDPLGWVGSCGYDETTAWCANIFTATESAALSAVGFYAAAADASYQFYVYTGVSAGQPRSGTPAITQSGTLSAAGYYTIPLVASVGIGVGQKFSVVVKLTTPGYGYPIPVEYAYAGYSSAAAASTGQSFLSYDGSYWEDALDVDSTMNVCIKAYASASSASVDPELFINDSVSSPAALKLGEQLSVTITLDTDSAHAADWWLLVHTPSAGWYYYNAYYHSWYAGLSVSYQGVLFNISVPFEALNMNTASLQAGTYDFYFGVDLSQNGQIDENTLCYKHAALEIVE